MSCSAHLICRAQHSAGRSQPSAEDSYPHFAAAVVTAANSQL